MCVLVAFHLRSHILQLWRPHRSRCCVAWRLSSAIPTGDQFPGKRGRHHVWHKKQTHLFSSRAASLVAAAPRARRRWPSSPAIWGQRVQEHDRRLRHSFNTSLPARSSPYLSALDKAASILRLGKRSRSPPSAGTWQPAVDVVRPASGRRCSR